MKQTVLLLFLTMIFSLASAAPTNSKKKCLYINSYKKGYEWSDGIEEATYQVLKDRCALQSFYMDTKANNSATFAKEKGLEAKAWIENEKPDLVIAADDAAVEYVLVLHFKDKPLPFVFCGINWEAKKYGLPFQNATGMIEVAPVEELANQIKEILPTAKKAVYLSGDAETDRVNLQVYSEIYQKFHIQLKAYFAKDMQQWENDFMQAQKADVVILANYAGIRDWSFNKAREIVRRDTKKMSVTYHEFMRPLVTLSMTKIPQEQGEWAGKVALEILDGASPVSIPVAVNRRWNLYVNDDVAKLAHVKIPELLERKANKVAL